MKPLAGSSGMELIATDSAVGIRGTEDALFHPFPLSSPQNLPSSSISSWPHACELASICRGRCRCRLSLYLGFLIPALLLASAFFVVTWITLDRSAKDSTELISNRLFSVTMMHLQYSMDVFLRTSPEIARMVQAQLESNSNSTQMKQFVTKSLLSLQHLTAIGVADSDGSFFVAHRSSGSNVRWYDKPPNNCSLIPTSECLFLSVWQMNVTTLQPLGPPTDTFRFNITGHPNWVAMQGNQVPTFWLVKEWANLTTEPNAAYGLPLFNPDRSFRGFIAVDVSLSGLSATLQSAHEALRTSGLILVVNNDGVPLISDQCLMGWMGATSRWVAGYSRIAVSVSMWSVW